jgi:signal transduction histidine kinase
LIDECLRTVEPLVKNDRLRLVKDLAAGLPALYTDQDKLKQILMNLLSNAVKFTPEGAITVTARHGAEKVILTVIDTGIGIPEDALGRIFEEFHQVRNGTTQEYGGTGLGLSISRHLVRLLDGEITVQSTSGVGSTFTVTLPLHYDVDPLTPHVSPAPSGAALVH